MNPLNRLPATYSPPLHYLKSSQTVFPEVEAKHFFGFSETDKLFAQFLSITPVDLQYCSKDSTNDKPAMKYNTTFLNFGIDNVFNHIHTICFSDVDQKEILKALNSVMKMITKASSHKISMFDGEIFCGLSKSNFVSIVGSTAWKILSTNFEIFKKILTPFFKSKSLSDKDIAELLKASFTKLKQNPYLDNTELNLKIVCDSSNARQPQLICSMIEKECEKREIELEYKFHINDSSHILSFKLENSRVEIFITDVDSAAILCSQGCNITVGDGNCIFSSDFSSDKMAFFLFGDIDTPNLKNPCALPRFFMNNSTLLANGFLELLIDGFFGESSLKCFSLYNQPLVSSKSSTEDKQADIQRTRTNKVFDYLNTELKKQLRFATEIEKSIKIQKRFSLVWNSLQSFILYDKIDDDSAAEILNRLIKENLIDDLLHIPLLNLLLNTSPKPKVGGYTCSNLFSIVQIFAFLYLPNCATIRQQPLQFIIKNELNIKFPADLNKSLKNFVEFTSENTNLNLIEELEQIFLKNSLNDLNQTLEAQKFILSVMETGSVNSVHTYAQKLLNHSSELLSLIGANLSIACKTRLAEEKIYLKTKFAIATIPKYIASNNQKLLSQFYLNFCHENCLTMSFQFDPSNLTNWLNLFLENKYFCDAAQKLWEKNINLFQKDLPERIFKAHLKFNKNIEALEFLFKHIEKIELPSISLLTFLENHYPSYEYRFSSEKFKNIKNKLISFFINKKNKSHIIRLINLLLKLDNKLNGIKLAIQEILNNNLPIYNLPIENSSLLSQVMPILKLHQTKVLKFETNIVDTISQMLISTNFTNQAKIDIAYFRLFVCYYCPLSMYNLSELKDEIFRIEASKEKLNLVARKLLTLFTGQEESESIADKKVENFISDTKLLAEDAKAFKAHKSNLLRASIKKALDNNSREDNRHLLKDLGSALIDHFELKIDYKNIAFDQWLPWAKLLYKTLDKDNFKLADELLNNTNETDIDSEDIEFIVKAIFKVDVPKAKTIFINFYNKGVVKAKGATELLQIFSKELDTFSSELDEILIKLGKDDELKNQVLLIGENLKKPSTRLKVERLFKDINNLNNELVDELLSTDLANLNLEKEKSIELANSICKEIISKFKETTTDYAGLLKKLALAHKFSQESNILEFTLKFALVKKNKKPIIDKKFLENEINLYHLIIIFQNLSASTIFNSKPGLDYISTLLKLEELNLINEQEISEFIEKLFLAIPDTLLTFELCSLLTFSKCRFSLSFYEKLINKYISKCAENFTEIPTFIDSFSFTEHIFTIYPSNILKIKKLIAQSIKFKFSSTDSLDSTGKVLGIGETASVDSGTENSYFTKFLLTNSLISALQIDNFVDLLGHLKFDQFVQERVWHICDGFIAHNKKSWKPELKQLVEKKYNLVLKLLIDNVATHELEDAQLNNLLRLINTFCDYSNNQLIDTNYLTLLKKIAPLKPKPTNNVYKFLLKPESFTKSKKTSEIHQFILHNLFSENFEIFISILKEHGVFDFYFEEIIDKIISRKLVNHNNYVVDFIESQAAARKHNFKRTANAFSHILKDTKYNDKLLEWFLAPPKSISSLSHQDLQKIGKKIYSEALKKEHKLSDSNLQIFTQNKFIYSIVDPEMHKSIDCNIELSKFKQNFIVNLNPDLMANIAILIINKLNYETKISNNSKLLFNRLLNIKNCLENYPSLSDLIDQHLLILINKGLIAPQHPITNLKIQIAFDKYSQYIDSDIKGNRTQHLKQHISLYLATNDFLAENQPYLVQIFRDFYITFKTNLHSSELTNLFKSLIQPQQEFDWIYFEKLLISLSKAIDLTMLARVEVNNFLTTLFLSEITTTLYIYIKNQKLTDYESKSKNTIKQLLQSWKNLSHQMGKTYLPEIQYESDLLKLQQEADLSIVNSNTDLSSKERLARIIYNEPPNYSMGRQPLYMCIQSMESLSQIDLQHGGINEIQETLLIYLKDMKVDLFELIKSENIGLYSKYATETLYYINDDKEPYVCELFEVIKTLLIENEEIKDGQFDILIIWYLNICNKIKEKVRNKINANLPNHPRVALMNAAFDFIAENPSLHNLN